MRALSRGRYIATAGIAAIIGMAWAQDQIVVILGTATPGGGFPLYGGVLADVVNEIEPSPLVRPRNTKGSSENITLLEAGKLDIALVQGESAHEAFSGIGRPPADLAITAAMYRTPDSTRPSNRWGRGV